MENMRSRIDRGDIKLERAEAIKVRAPASANRLFKLIHITPRQCVISQQIALSNSNIRRYASFHSMSNLDHALIQDNFVGAV
jgi:hypothetical protein